MRTKYAQRTQTVEKWEIKPLNSYKTLEENLWISKFPIHMLAYFGEWEVQAIPKAISP